MVFSRFATSSYQGTVMRINLCNCSPCLHLASHPTRELYWGLASVTVPIPLPSCGHQARNEERPQVTCFFFGVYSSSALFSQTVWPFILNLSIYVFIFTTSLLDPSAFLSKLIRSSDPCAQVEEFSLYPIFGGILNFPGILVEFSSFWELTL